MPATRSRPSAEQDNEVSDLQDQVAVEGKEKSVIESTEQSSDNDAENETVDSEENNKSGLKDSTDEKPVSTDKTNIAKDLKENIDQTDDAKQDPEKLKNKENSDKSVERLKRTSEEGNLKANDAVPEKKSRSQENEDAEVAA